MNTIKTSDINLSEKGVITHRSQIYGQSVNGIPLSVYVPQGAVKCLIFSGIHGEEPESTVLLSRALRCTPAPLQHCAVILAANPDGLLLGTRGNANGVDLNRNFPASNWTHQAVKHRWSLGDEQAVSLSSGEQAASEPETQALMNLIKQLSPKQIISIHAPLGCIDDPVASPLGKKMAERTNMPLVPDVGTPTPGSFGTWCAEQNHPIITYELPADSIWSLLDDHLKLLQDLLVNPMLE